MMNMLSDILNLSNIIAFLVGILSGILLMLGVFLIIISSGKREKRKAYSPTINALNEEKIDEMILNKQNDLVHEVDDNDKPYASTTFVLAKELIHEISSYYYPDSKYPEYELTIVEAADLIKYVADKIVQLFDKPILRRFKNTSLSNVASLLEKSRKISKSAVAKTMSDGGSEAIGAYKATVNILNPVYWFKKIVINGTINIAIRKACKAGLSIIGNESNKVYSKNMFNVEDVKLKEKINEVFSDEED